MKWPKQLRTSKHEDHLYKTVTCNRQLSNPNKWIKSKTSSLEHWCIIKCRNGDGCNNNPGPREGPACECLIRGWSICSSIQPEVPSGWAIFLFPEISITIKSCLLSIQFNQHVVKKWLLALHIAKATRSDNILATATFWLQIGK